MVNGINKTVAKYGDWIFLGAALYRFVFYILDLVSAFNSGAGYGVKTMFRELFEIALYLILLAAVIGITRKLTGIKGVSITVPTNNNMPQAPSAQFPAQGSTISPANSVWFCSSCGTQNNGETSFCSNCGKPK